MARNVPLLSALLALVACSNSSTHPITRGLGSGERADAATDDASEDEAPAAESGASEEGSDAAIDAAAGAANGGESLDAGSQDAALASGGDASAESDASVREGAPLSMEAAAPQEDAGGMGDSDVPPPDPNQPFALRVVIDNPHGNPNPVAYRFDDMGVAPDEYGYLYARSEPQIVKVVLGESDETEVLPFFGLKNGDELHFYYRHFREPVVYRPIQFPTLLPGTRDLTAQSSAGLDFMAATGGAGSVRAHLVGASSYIGTARGETSGVLGFAIAKAIQPPPDVPFSAVVLGPWLTPRTVSVDLAHGSDQSSVELFLHQGEDTFQALEAGPSTFVIPPAFADYVEARASESSGETIGAQDYAVTRLVARCGAEADRVALDLADALPTSTATAQTEGGQKRWMFPSLAAADRGDLLIFDGNVMPATQASLLLPAARTSHVLIRVDVDSAADYRALLRAQPLPLKFELSAPWCRGTDRVRITRVEWVEP